jgi:uncharacterized DUF497 family protein
VEELLGCTGFEWDEGNIDKNWLKHRVSWTECEELFFNQPLIVAKHEKHSPDEPRYYALGRTDAGRWLFVVFTVRRSLVRVISAREMSKKERRAYDHAQEGSDEEGA